MKHTLFIFALLTASIQTFAQSPRIKLNQITKDSLTGSVLISSPTDSGMVYSRDLFISYGADTVLILGGDTLAATSSIISSVLSDGVTITGDGTLGSELTADTSVLATLRALSDSLALVSSSVTADNVTITGDGTVGSPLEVDTATVISSVGRLLDSLINIRTDLDLKQDQLNGTGFVKATGTTISYDNSTYLTSEVDGSVTNEIQDISTTGAAGNISISSGSTLNLNVDDADASTSNELQTLSYNSSTNEITLSDGGGTEDLSNLDLVDSTRINATGDTAYYYQNGVLIGTGPIAEGGGGTTYNNISETVDTVYIDSFLNVDNGTLYVDAVENRVGIGTKTPAHPFQIVDTTGGFLQGLSIRKGQASKTGADGFTYKNALIVSGYSSDATVIDRNLTMGMWQLTDEDGNYGNFNFFSSSGNNVGGFGMNYIDHSGRISDFYFATANGGSATTKMTIKADGGIEIPSLLNASTGNTMYYNTTSDEISYSSSSIRFKEEIEDLPIGLNELMDLKPTRYTYIPDGQKDYGYIAEQVYDSGLTEFVTFNESGQIEGLKDKYFMVLHTKAIQEQQAIIETQATEIDQLKELITELNNRLTILENK